MGCFRISELQLILTLQSSYTDFTEILKINNLILILITVLSIYSQKHDNFSSLEQFSKKINLSILAPIAIVIILTGLAINTGTSEKFIYFDF